MGPFGRIVAYWGIVAYRGIAAYLGHCGIFVALGHLGVLSNIAGNIGHLPDSWMSAWQLCVCLTVGFLPDRTRVWDRVWDHQMEPGPASRVWNQGLEPYLAWNRGLRPRSENL